MTDDERERERDRLLLETRDLVKSINETLNGRGGWYDRVEKLERESQEHATFKTRLIAYGTVATVIVGGLWSFILDLLRGPHPKP